MENNYLSFAAKMAIDSKFDEIDYYAKEINELVRYAMGAEIDAEERLNCLGTIEELSLRIIRMI